MNIWIFHQYSLSPNNKGITRLFDLSKTLIKKGHKVTIITTHKNHRNPEGCLLQKDEKFRFEEFDGVEYIWLRGVSSKRGAVSRILNMLYFSKQILEKRGMKNKKKPDAIIGASPDLFSATAAGIIAKELKIPFCLHLNDLWPAALIDIGQKSSKHPFILLLKFLEKKLYQRAEMITSFLPNIQNYIQDQLNNLNSKEVIWLPPFINLSEISFKVKEKPGKQFHIIYAGSHGLANCLFPIIKAAKVLDQDKSNNVKFTFIGDGEEKQKLIEFKNKNNISNISFQPPMEKKNLFQELQKADAFIINTGDFKVFETGGLAMNKIFEYLALGRPIIICSPFHNNIIEKYNAGITTSCIEPKQIADDILKLKEKSLKEKNTMGLNGRKNVEKYHQIENTSDILEKSLKKLIKKSL